MTTVKTKRHRQENNYERRCSKCELTLPISKFRTKSNGWLQAWCKSCEEIYQSERRKRPEVVLRFRELYLKNKYDISLEEYDKMLAKQEGVCAICGEPETKMNARSGEIQPLSVDHHHETGRVRSLLCNRCNVVLGHIAEDVEILSSMIDYLSRY